MNGQSWHIVEAGTNALALLDSRAFAVGLAASLAAAVLIAGLVTIAS
jgi:hypothetical protein